MSINVASVTPSINTIVKDANSWAEMAATIQQVNPALAASLVVKPLAMSKSPAGTLIAGIIGVVVSKYGLDLSPDGVLMLSGAFVVVGSYFMRAITHGSISGLFTSPGAVTVATGA
jgi:hypothetical protein